MRGVLALVCLVACERRAPIESCAQDLGGEYTVDGARWMVIDRGTGLEVYPLFPDVPPAAGLEVAPRVLDLERADDGTLAGHVRRRYMRGAVACTSRTPVHITGCAGDTLDVVLADPAPPTGFAPCTYAPAEPSRRERWHHE